MVRTYKKRVKFRAVNNQTREVIDICVLKHFCEGNSIDYELVKRRLAQRDSVDTGLYTITRI